MRNSLLIPSKYKVFGWIIFLLFATLGAFCVINDFEIPGLQIYHISKEAAESLSSGFQDFNLTNEFAIFGITIGLLMITFAKEKIEDEYISMLRLRSLQWAVLLSYIILLILNFSFYGLTFLFLLVYNVWTTLLIFIIKFYWSLYQLKKGDKNEK